MTGDEAFMTGTPFCLLPVTALNGVAIGTGRMGPMVRLLLDTWSREVGVDIEAQIKNWDAAQGSEAPRGPSPYSFKGLERR